MRGKEAWSCAEIQCQNRKPHWTTIFVSHWKQIWAVLLNSFLMGTQTELEQFWPQLNGETSGSSPWLQGWRDLKTSRTVRNKRLLNGSFLICFLSNACMDGEKFVEVTTSIIWLTVCDCCSPQKIFSHLKKPSCYFLKISFCTVYLLQFTFSQTA